MFEFHPYPDDLKKAILQARTHVSIYPLFLDTETTGLDLELDEICEVAIVGQDGQVLVNSLVKPTRPISAGAARVHGITDEMVAGAPSFRDLLEELDRVLKGRIVLVWNRDFDWYMIANSARANGYDLSGNDGFHAWWWSPRDWTPEHPGQVWDPGWYCAMELYARYYGEWNDYHGNYRWQRLAHAARQCGIELPPGIHHAHADAELTRRIVLHVAGQTIQEASTNEEIKDE